MITIKPFEPAFTEALITFILDIQQNEFGLPIKREDQSDLANIPEEFQQGKSNFWIAVDVDQLIGTIALSDLGAGKAALRKMFVHKDYRGATHGLAMKLLNTLITWAKEQQLSDLYLGTADKLHAAHRFYEKNGFVLVTRNEVPDGKYIMAVDTKFYHLAL
ncbi:GNAT family N-acetyltransferase [Chitinophaga sp. SYP-B3965]|uniref:GNAT family N-acetyltransferase n=1 Tax=Chitinophaga sp. SYP-B3965 TaxID=2663120 RepID=UPI001299C25D|nr:GNAT family N-acetyltransferase [Chitinophaga sp. SYP-B3965]MRG47140.1 GNAT family N-acetyltransferase [Chitinophaga sp. SYP-B3965]